MHFWRFFKRDALQNLSIDLASQALAQMTIRPKYGSCRSLMYEDNIAESSTVTIFSISGKGMVYGGHIHHDFTGTNNYIALKVVVDGQSTWTENLLKLHERKIRKTGMWYLWEEDYTANTEYTQGIMGEITFESSYAVTIYNLTGSGAQDTIYARLLYALL